MQVAGDYNCQMFKHHDDQWYNWINSTFRSTTLNLNLWPSCELTVWLLLNYAESYTSIRRHFLMLLKWASYMWMFCLKVFYSMRSNQILPRYLYSYSKYVCNKRYFLHYTDMQKPTHTHMYLQTVMRIELQFIDTFWDITAVHRYLWDITAVYRYLSEILMNSKHYSAHVNKNGYCVIMKKCIMLTKTRNALIYVVQ